MKINAFRVYFLTIVALLPSATSVFATGIAIPVFDNREWKLGWSQPSEFTKAKDTVFDEYVLSGETVETWSELVTIQFFPELNKHINLDVFESMTKLNLTVVDPGIKWQSLYQNENERMWEWSMQNVPGQTDQSEIARAVKTANGIHVFHYAIKKSPLPTDSKETWVHNLKSIQIMEAVPKQ